MTRVFAAAAVICGGGLLSLAPATSAGAAAAVVAEQRDATITGEVLQLTSVQDTESMAAMARGQAVTWDVGVSARRDDGTISTVLHVGMPADAFSVRVQECAVRWTAAGCSAGAHEVLAPVTAAGTYALSTYNSADQRWFRMVVTAVSPPAQADLRFVASGLGEEIDVGGPSDRGPDGASGVGSRLAFTGVDPWAALGLACGALGSGMVMARVARGRWRS